MRDIPPIPSLEQVRDEPIPWFVQLLLFAMIILAAIVLLSAFLGATLQ